MASHTGTLTGNNILALLAATVFEDVVAFDMSPYRAWLDSLTLFGVKAHVSPAAPVDSKTGVSSPDYADLWYNHIHIIPNRINVGNLTSTQVRPIEIFNGYFEERTLETVTNNGLSGVGFDVTLPLVLAAIESVYRDITIDTVGTPQFDGSFTLGFDNGDHFLYVTGKRVLAMPFQHDWSEKIIERLAWYNTSSGKSLDGIEQLVMWRDKPRRSLDYQFLLASNNTNAARLRALFNSLVYGWQARIFAVPIWTDATRLKVTADAGQDIISFNTTYFDYDIGSYIMLWQSEENYELIEIDEVHTTYIKTKVNLANQWIAGKTILLPARLGYMNQNVQGVKHTVDIDVAPVSFELLPQYTSVNRLVHASAVTYRTFPVLLTKNNYSSTNTFALEQQPIRNDASIGIFTLTPDAPAPDGSNSFSLLFANHTQIAEFYGWLDDRKGRIGVFWLPTWSKDMQVVQNIGSAGTNILIKSIGYTSLYYIDDAPAFNRRDIMINLKNGMKFFRRILGVSVNLDNTETVSINTALGQDVNISDIDRVSFLLPSSLKADVVQVDWHSGNISESNFVIQEVYDDTI